MKEIEKFYEINGKHYRVRLILVETKQNKFQIVPNLCRMFLKITTF